MGENRLFGGLMLHTPTECDKCQGSLKYNGIGEYVCQDCGCVMYDDYGKVRNYLENHRGATQGEVSRATGVSSNAIREMLRANKIELAPGSALLMVCVNCGKQIRSGRYCDACQAQINRQSDAPKSKTTLKGFGKTEGGKGSWRYN